MLYDSQGNPIAPEPLKLVDPVYDPRVEPGPYVLPNVRTDNMTPELRADLSNEIERARFDAAGDVTRQANLDAFVNELTGGGTVGWDKTLGGNVGGPCVRLYRIRAPEAEAMTRGTDLGHNIVNKKPDEMTREWFKTEIQPTEEDSDIASDPASQMDACIHEPRRAAAGWRREANGRTRTDAARCYENAHRWDVWPNQREGTGEEPRPNGVSGVSKPPAGLGAATAPPPPPGPLPKLNDEGIEIAEALRGWEESVRIEWAFNLALKYEREFGGGCILIGVDDGVEDLTQPLDPKKVRRVTHLTPLSGGWDGEAVMWRPYNDPRKKKYGEPEIYQVRNLSVQLARPPAPGETHPVSQLIPMGPTGPTIFYVHESRMIIFDGEPASRQAQQEMRGWGDSIYTRVKEVLAQFDQTWNAVAALMQEFSMINMGIDGYSALLASNNPNAKNALLERARQIQLTRSAYRMNVYDAKDKVERMSVSLAGVPELLDGPLARRLAAAADEPVSILFGQVIGSIGGGAGEAERTSWYNTLRSEQKRKIVPKLTSMYKLVFQSSEGPTRGKVPERWNVEPNPLWQPTPGEQADLRLKTSQADQIEIQSQVVTPEEVAATRYGGAEYNPGPIVIDIEGRQQQAQVEAEQQQKRALAAQQKPIVEEGSPETQGSTPLPKPVIDQPIYDQVPPMTAMPSDPITADPTTVPSAVEQTGAGGKPLKTQRPQTEG